MTETPMAMAAGAVSRDRLWDSLMTMATFGALPKGGVNRLALSAEDIAARGQMRRWAAAHGFADRTDEIGNLFVRRDGTEPGAAPVLTGSHLDTQPKGGKFDGAYGVLAGLEALIAIHEADIETRRPLEVVAWMNEEGSRFRPGVMGSAVFAGKMALADALATADGDGVTVAAALDEVKSANGDSAVLSPAGFPVAAYVEAHIEQGPVLEAERKTIGVVTGIQGIKWFDVQVTGREDHAGTTPLSARKDALKAAVAMIASLEMELGDPDDRLRFTVGRFDTLPGSPSTVPGAVLFTIDLRHPDAATLNRMADLIEPVCRSNRRGCAVTVTQTMDAAPTDFGPPVVDAVRRAAAALEIPAMELPSGAGHDAMNLNGLCPTGMIFIPCEGGVSHNEAENATPEDCAAGAGVLAATLVDLTSR